MLAREYNKDVMYKSHFKALEQVIAMLQEGNKGLWDKIEKAHVHCNMAIMENDSLQKRLNTKEARARQGKKHTLATDSRTFTSGEGLLKWQEQQADLQAKEQRRQEREQQQAEKTAQREAERQARAESRVFTGPISKKNHDELDDLVVALGIDIDGKQIKSMLTEAIRDHFKTHPEL